MNRLVVVTAQVLVTLAGGVARPATDDHGMRHASAAKGVHGSIRADVIILRDGPGQADGSLAGDGPWSLRLWIGGEVEHGRLASTYRWEARQETGDALATHAFEVGLRGAFGSVAFGKLDMAPPRLVPGADLALGRGLTRPGIAAEPGANGVRYETPSLRGWRLGLSGRAPDTKRHGGGELGVAATYTDAGGLSAGLGYERSRCPGRCAVNMAGQDGWRAGVRYGKATWLVAYERRRYANHEGFEIGQVVTNFRDPASNIALPVQATLFAAHDSDHTKGLGYALDAVGAQVKLGRATVSAHACWERLSLAAAQLVVPLSPGLSPFHPGLPGKLRQRTIALDLAHPLGARSVLSLGWRGVTKDEVGLNMARDGNDLVRLRGEVTYLAYHTYF